MSDLSEIYGTDYKSKAYQSKILSIINSIGTNLSNEHYRFTLNDINELFQSESMPNNVIDALITKVMKNQALIMRHINKHTNDINMIPILIVNVPIEYFYVIDKNKARAYFIYITPTEVNAY